MRTTVLKDRGIFSVLPCQPKSSEAITGQMLSHLRACCSGYIDMIVLGGEHRCFFPRCNLPQTSALRAFGNQRAVL